MSVSYRVGDRVRVLTWMELMKRCGAPNEVGDICDGELGGVFSGFMFDYCNSVGTICHVKAEGSLFVEVENEARKAFLWMSPNFVQPLSPDTADLSLNFEDIFA